MNGELLKFGSGLIALSIVSYTIISVAEKRNGMKFRSYGSFELESKIVSGNERILTELRNLKSQVRDLKTDVDKKMDVMSNSFALSNKKINQELKYLRGTHIDVELMKKNWSFNVSDNEREKYMKYLVIVGRASLAPEDDE